MKRQFFRALALMAGVACACAAGAQDIAGAAPAAMPVAASASPVQSVIPANTVLQLELVTPVSSKTARPGDFFELRVSHAVAIDGVTLVPAGARVVGQVVHAQRAGGGGKAGELIIAARHVDLPQGPLKLRSTFGAAGQNHSVASLVTAQFIGPFAMAVRGGETVLPPGTPMLARTAEPFDARVPPVDPAPTTPAAIHSKDS